MESKCRGTYSTIKWSVCPADVHLRGLISLPWGVASAKGYLKYCLRNGIEMPSGLNLKNCNFRSRKMLCIYRSQLSQFTFLIFDFVAYVKRFVN